MACVRLSRRGDVFLLLFFVYIFPFTWRALDARALDAFAHSVIRAVLIVRARERTQKC